MFEPSKPRNTLQKERLDGLEHREDIRYTRKAGGSVPSPGKQVVSEVIGNVGE